MRFSIDDSIIKNKSISANDKIIFAIIDSNSMDARLEGKLVTVSKIYYYILKLLDIDKKTFERSLSRLEQQKLISGHKLLNDCYKIMMPDKDISEEMMIASRKVIEEKEQAKAKKKTITNLEKDIINSVIDYLNEKTGKHFRSNTESTKDLLLSLIRSNEYDKKDFIQVIDNMCSWWKDDPNMEKYLRPTTLFTKNHMDKYLNMGIKKDSSNAIREKRLERDEQRKNAQAKGWG